MPIVDNNNNYDIENWKYEYGQAISYDIYNYTRTNSDVKTPLNPTDYIDYPGLISNGTILILLYQNSTLNNYIQQGSFSSTQGSILSNMINVSAPIGVYKVGTYKLKATVLRANFSTSISNFKYNIGFYQNGTVITTTSVSVKLASNSTNKTYTSNANITDEGTVTITLTIPTGSTLINKNIGIKIINKSIDDYNSIFIGNVKLITPDSCNNLLLF